MTIICVYSNGVAKEHTFATKEEMAWFIHNEGDHLISWFVKTGED